MWKKFGLILLSLLIAVMIADASLLWFFSTKQSDLTQVHQADAAIILGAAINTPALRMRTLEALDIYQQGKTQVLVLSGGKVANADIAESEYMHKVIQQYQTSEVITIEDDKSRNTYQNLVNSRQLLQTNGLPHGSVIIVSDTYHLARAVLMAKRLGFETVYWQAPNPSYYTSHELRYYYLREFVAILSYIPKFILG